MQHDAIQIIFCTLGLLTSLQDTVVTDQHVGARQQNCRALQNVTRCSTRLLVVAMMLAKIQDLQLSCLQLMAATVSGALRALNTTNGICRRIDAYSGAMCMLTGMQRKLHMQCSSRISIAHHISHKATVAAAPSLIVITWPHDLNACQRTKSAKLLFQDVLIDIC